MTFQLVEPYPLLIAWFAYLVLSALFVAGLYYTPKLWAAFRQAYQHADKASRLNRSMRREYRRLSPGDRQRMFGGNQR